MVEKNSAEKKERYLDDKKINEKLRIEKEGNYHSIKYYFLNIPKKLS